jgi:NitT/TauT family transport system substrate-binding protein
MRSSAVAAIAVAGILAGCDATAEPDRRAGFDKISVSAIASVDSAPLFLGRAKGIFDKQRIDLTISTVQNGAASVSGATRGQFPIGLANTAALLVARSQGADVKVLANGVSSTGKPGKDFSAILVKDDSPVQSAADLDGVKVAVSQVKSIGDTTVRASIRKAGGDPAKARFVDVPVDQAPAKLAAGEVDAICVAEPYVTVALSQGARIVGWNYADTTPGLTTAMYFTTGKYAAEHADLVRRFTAALVESLEYATAHESQVRQIVTSYLKVDASVPGKMVLPNWPSEVNKASVQRIADLARGDGVLTKAVDVESLLP